MILQKCLLVATGTLSGLLVAQVAAQAPAQVPFLEYGALGLCSAMVLMSHMDRRELVKDLRSMRETSNKLIETNTAALQGVKDVISKCRKSGE